MKTKEDIVNLGYTTNEPSVFYLAYTYYLTFFPSDKAKDYANKYCEQLEKICNHV